MSRIVEMISCVVVLIAVMLSSHQSSAFSTVQMSKCTRTTTTATAETTALFNNNLASDDGDDESLEIPPAEEYTGSVDWDAEWKKVVKNDDPSKLDTGKERPGSTYYKSEAEIAAIKTANAATKKVSEATSSVSKVIPDIRSLSGDWKFWVATLAIISIGISVLSAPQNVPTGLQGDSYYI
mmetsp:Transcript_55162/g.134037  ORF Transcript_55162/g.134037 Transcript_55162/m.134037 type:complete len:181 (+) Transcript_55162:82-624(+)